jgi:hypothetical protein
VITARLPEASLAVIERRKITDYLLTKGHPAGRAKAAFFQRFGFAAASWERLRDALLEHARSARVVSTADTPFGKKYILEGPLIAPDGRKPLVRAVWFVRPGETASRFVTAYPLPGVRR